MKQSLKFSLPKINPSKNSVHLLKKILKEHCALHIAKNRKKDIKKHCTNSEKITILIGPEGDFSLDEIAKPWKKNSNLYR